MDYGDVIKAWAKNPEAAFRRRDLHGAMSNGRVHGPGEIIRKSFYCFHNGMVRENIYRLDESSGRWLMRGVCEEDIFADDWEEVPQDVLDGLIEAGKRRYEEELNGFLEDMRRQKGE